MKKRLLKILCIVLSFVIIIVSVTFIKKDKPANQQIDITESTASETTTEAETTTETTTETTEAETTTEATTIAETTTKKAPLFEFAPVSSTSLELERLVISVAEKYGAAAVQVATIKDGMVSQTAEYGWAVANERPIETDTNMRIASLSKTPIGMVVFKLVEEGLLDIDADISDYLGVVVRHPEYPDLPITLRMLLTHTSGLTDKSYQDSLEKIQNHLLTPEAYQEKPGQIFRYNNYGFGIAATICECVTGKSLNNLAKEYFFNPMGIDASYLGGQLNPQKVATVYNSEHKVGLSVERQIGPKNDRNIPGRYMMLYAGGLTISASDLAKLLTVFVNDGMYNGMQLLSMESITQMQTPQLPNNYIQCMPIKKKVGLYNQEYMYHHSGSAYGTYSFYMYNPDSKIGAVVITTGAQLSRDRYGIYSVCGDIVDGIIKQNLL